MAGRGRLGPWYRLAIVLLKAPTVLLSRREGSGAEPVPQGGVILAAITSELEVLRGEPAPAQAYDPRGECPGGQDGRRTA